MSWMQESEAPDPQTLLFLIPVRSLEAHSFFEIVVVLSHTTSFKACACSVYSCFHICMYSCCCLSRPVPLSACVWMYVCMCVWTYVRM